MRTAARTVSLEESHGADEPTRASAPTYAPTAHPRGEGMPATAQSP
ncbi:hypothetical protein SBD_3025 [Streptomyces bottropensis ATCC 25435]|uniref:Uncharacterized protein n=1 Tax=Streptomyces bottropensis ATCC 25435 TaxID=1054862 RepID=M3DGC1_9ACTN|nr:hypothetical protein SBD_3025 [Streptomyces bottropensis ATCC 25435]